MNLNLSANSFNISPKQEFFAGLQPRKCKEKEFKKSFKYLQTIYNNSTVSSSNDDFAVACVYSNIPMSAITEKLQPLVRIGIRFSIARLKIPRSFEITVCPSTCEEAIFMIEENTPYTVWEDKSFWQRQKQRASGH